jgi:hypothetical protein
MQFHDGHNGLSISRRGFLRTGTFTAAAVQTDESTAYALYPSPHLQSDQLKKEK